MPTTNRTIARRLLAGFAAATLMLAHSGTPEASNAPHGGHVGIAPGKNHPDLWLPDTEGRVRKLSDFAGQKLLIFHFASW